MKMTKIAFWRLAKKNCDKHKNGCNGVDCDLCPVKSELMCYLCYKDININDCLAYANKQIKIHESKTKKPAVKTDVRDMKNVVKDETVKESLTVDPTPLDIAKAIRDNGYNCVSLRTIDDACSVCPFDSLTDCGSGREEGTESFKFRKTLIDTYISEREKVEPVIPEPIKFSDNVPVYVYMVTDKAIKKEKAIAFLQRKTESGIVERIVFDYGGEHTFENCYKTLADAVKVAEEKWGVK